MRPLFALSFLSLVLAGCAFSTQTYSPSGKPAQSIKFKGAANDWGSCYEKAGDLCGTAGYDVVAQDGQTTPFGMANGYANASGGSFSAFRGGMVSRNLLVQCRTPA